jgi:hypothetical protein
VGRTWNLNGKCNMGFKGSNEDFQADNVRKMDNDNSVFLTVGCAAP